MPFNDPPWIPMSNPRDIKTLGKLGEECGELSAAISRCLIQGIEEKEPVTGKVNVIWLEEEIADVLLNCELVMERFNLSSSRITERQNRKETGLRSWHEGTPS